jgi:basic amino acid/polyamine antiporter, APA family
MLTLAHKLRLVDYFVLAFGVMVGTAWLVVMDDLLQRGGPLGALLGFTLGALMLLPIGYVYGELVRAIPDAAGEAAYVARLFSPKVSFVTGWMTLLSYFLTCPFEALAAGRIAGYLFPCLNSGELYRLGGRPVYLPHLLLGLLIIVCLTYLNYRGIQASARIAKTTTFTFLTLVVIFALAGARHGSASNFRPLFSHTPLISILLVWQVVPWLLGGFESVGKYVEEASSDFKAEDYFLAIGLTIVVGMAFFWVVISAVAYVTPWQTLQSAQQFPTALAFERALRAHWIVTLILASAMVALLQAFNANLVASSRLLFAMGRRGLVDHRLAYVHPRSLAPSVAIVAVGVGSLCAMLLGDAGLVPILEVGALASSIAWMAACASCYRLNPSREARAAAIFGLFVTSMMVLFKLVPIVPGHFSQYEWIALAIWLALGFLVRWRAKDPHCETLGVARTAAGSDIS